MMKRSTAVGASVAVAAATLLAYKLHQRRRDAKANPVVPPTARTSKDGVFELGAAEQSLGAMSIHNGMFRVAIRLRLQSGEPVQLPVLRKALARLQARHPVLRCTFQQEAIEPKPEPPLPAHKVSLKEQPDVPLAIIEAPASGNSVAALDAAWATCWAEVQHQPFVPGASLVQLVVIQDKEPSTDPSVNHLTELGFVIEHGVSDGISASYVAHELLEQLALLSSSDDAPPDVESLPFLPTMEDTVPACGPLPPLPGPPAAPSRFSSLLSRGRALLGLAPAAAPPTPPVETHDHFDCIPHTEREDPVVNHTLYGHLSKEDTRNLIANCRARKVTVTAAVVAAEAAAAAAVLHSSRKSSKATAGTPAGDADATDAGEAAAATAEVADETVEVQTSLAVDIRKLYKPEPYAGYHLGFHVSGMRPVSKHFAASHVPAAPPALWEHATAVRQSIVSGMEMSLVFVPFMGPALAGAAIDPPADAPPTGPTVSLSSWGKLPFVETYGDFTLLSAIPAVNCTNATAYPATLVSTANDELTVTAINGASLSVDAVLEPLVDGTMANLRLMAEVEGPRPEE